VLKHKYLKRFLVAFAVGTHIKAILKLGIKKNGAGNFSFFLLIRLNCKGYMLMNPICDKCHREVELAEDDSGTSKWYCRNCGSFRKLHELVFKSTAKNLKGVMQYT